MKLIIFHCENDKEMQISQSAIRNWQKKRTKFPPSCCCLDWHTLCII